MAWRPVRPTLPGTLSRGAEISFTRRFSELPAPFDGLLGTANATFSDSEAEIALRDEDIDLPGQPHTVANLILGYERGPL